MIVVKAFVKYNSVSHMDGCVVCVESGCVVCRGSGVWNVCRTHQFKMIAVFFLNKIQYMLIMQHSSSTAG